MEPGQLLCLNFKFTYDLNLTHDKSYIKPHMFRWTDAMPELYKQYLLHLFYIKQLPAGPRNLPCMLPLLRYDLIAVNEAERRDNS